MDCNTLYSSLPNLWYKKTCTVELIVLLQIRHIDHQWHLKLEKVKKFKCIGPPRQFRGDFNQMKWLKRDFYCDYPQRVGDVQRVYTLQLLEQKYRGITITSLSIIDRPQHAKTKANHHPPPPAQKNRRKERASRILRNKPPTAKMM